MLQEIRNRIGSMFGYDAVIDKGKRRMTTARSVSEDRELNAAQRRQLQASARDLPRNFAVAAWAIRKHLDFVSRFAFDCTSGDDAFDAQLEALMEDASTPDNWDISGRHDRDRWLRLFEARACVDGDVMAVKLRNGKLQAIESDRIRNKEQGDTDEIVHGVRLNRWGRAAGYQVHRRLIGGGFEYEREISAENAVFHGYFDRFDQIRGISPLAPGLNSLQDVYENFDYALAKAKISQLFGMKFTRAADDSPGSLEEEVPDTEPDGPRYKVSFGNKPILLDLEPGDDASFLESNNPSVAFREFTIEMIQVALKSLDIPLCFYNEAHTNFYGSKSAATLYVESCKAKRCALSLALSNITDWKIRQWVMDGQLVLPAGMKINNVPYSWIHAGMPWWDASKEVNADLQAVRGGLRTRSEIRKERYGDNWFEVARKLRNEEVYAEQIGLVMESVVLPQQPDPQTGGSDANGTP